MKNHLYIYRQKGVSLLLAASYAALGLSAQTVWANSAEQGGVEAHAHTHSADSALAGADLSVQKPVSVERKVIKWSEKDAAGQDAERHYEIITENGVTQAWSIDARGNRIAVDADRIDMPDTAAGSGAMIRAGDLDIEGLEGLEGSDRKLIIQKLGEPPSGDHSPRILVLKSSKDITASGMGGFDVDGLDMNIEAHHLGGAGLMVKVAAQMLEEADEDGLSPYAQAKLAAARRAVEEARQAIEVETP